MACERDETEAGPSTSGALINPQLVTETPTEKTLTDGEWKSYGRDARNEAETIGNAKSVPNVSEDGAVASGKDSKKKAGRPWKQRLVSFSSQSCQDSHDLDGKGLRKSSGSVRRCGQWGE